MNGGLAIFVKTPGYSPLKTRLAVGIGSESATQWYLAAAQAVESIAEQLRQQLEMSVYWAVAEELAIKHHIWKKFPALAQGDGGLGERMGHVHSLLVKQHGFGFLIGADAPQICADDFLPACLFLSHTSPRLVIGPASDGGFWCVAANRAIPMSVWASVEYSQANTCEDFLALLPEFECLRLRALTDVDQEQDLDICQVALDALMQPTSAQMALSRLIRARHIKVEA
jgi:uncharacterized protein